MTYLSHSDKTAHGKAARPVVSEMIPDENIVTLIPVYGHREEIEMTLRNAITNAKWFGCTKNRQIICLNLGADAETYKICKIFSEEYDSIELYSLEEFDSVMRQSSVQVG